MEKVNKNQSCCAHINVKYKPVENDNGLTSSHWKCIDCNHEFVPIGRIQVPYHHEKKSRSENVELAKQMREDGYSIRQIMKVIGYKSTNAVVKLLKK